MLDTIAQTMVACWQVKAITAVDRANALASWSARPAAMRMAVKMMAKTALFRVLLTSVWGMKGGFVSVPAASRMRSSASCVSFKAAEAALSRVFLMLDGKMADWPSTYASSMSW